MSTLDCSFFLYLGGYHIVHPMRTHREEILYEDC